MTSEYALRKELDRIRSLDADTTLARACRNDVRAATMCDTCVAEAISKAVAEAWEAAVRIAQSFSMGPGSLSDPIAEVIAKTLRARSSAPETKAAPKKLPTIAELEAILAGEDAKAATVEPAKPELLPWNPRLIREAGGRRVPGHPSPPWR